MKADSDLGFFHVKWEIADVDLVARRGNRWCLCDKGGWEGGDLFPASDGCLLGLGDARDLLLLYRLGGTWSTLRLAVRLDNLESKLNG